VQRPQDAEGFRDPVEGHEQVVVVGAGDRVALIELAASAALTAAVRPTASSSDGSPRVIRAATKA
jgi:hypothetical protein